MQGVSCLLWALTLSSLMLSLGSPPGYSFRDKDFKFKFGDEVTITLIDAHKVALHSNKTLCKREKQFINFLRSTKSIRPLCL